MSDDTLVLRFKMVPPGGTLPPDLILAAGDVLQVTVRYNAGYIDGWSQPLLETTSTFEAAGRVQVIFDYAEIVSGDPQKIAEIYYNERRLT